MTNVKARRGFWTCAFIARVFVFVFVLQGIAVAASHERVGLAAFGSEAMVSMGVAYCSSDKAGDEGAPGRHDHSECCVLCSSNTHGGLIRFAEILFDILVFPTFPSVAVGWRFSDDLVAPPIGLRGSWSPRAPPSFP